MAHQVTITIEDGEYTLTDEQKVVYDQLLEFGMDPLTAVQVASGQFQDDIVLESTPAG